MTMVGGVPPRRTTLAMRRGQWTDFVLLDRVGTILTASPSVCAPMGLDVGDLVGRTLVDLVDDADRADLVACLDAETTSAADSFVRLARVRLRCRGERSTEVVLRGSPVRLEGRSLGVRVMMPTQAPVDDGLDGIIAGLLGRSEALQRAGVEIDRSVHAVAHDLRTPLTVVSMSAELLARMVGTEHGDAAGSVLSMLLDAVRRMDDLLDDVLQLGAGSVTEVDEVDCDDLVGKVLGELAPELAGARVDVVPLGAVRANRTQLRRVFQNLLSNAARYRAPDRPLAVGLSVRDVGDDRVFTVADNGVGISAQHRDDVFEAFHRLSASGAGSGLGLSICRQVVERHGGRIWIDGAPGGGTAVSFSLPASGPEHVADPPDRVDRAWGVDLELPT